MFFSVITKNLIWEILTKNLITFKRWDGLKDGKFQYYLGSLKNLIFKAGPRKTNMPKKWGLESLQKEVFSVFEGGTWYPNAHYDDKGVSWIFPKMPSEIFCLKICWQNSEKASFMYQQ